MRNRFAILSLVATLAGVAAVWLAPVASSADNFGVTICHRTGSDKNPYHAITPSNIGVYSAHIQVAGEPEPHPDKDGRPDFTLPFPGGSADDCKAAEPPKE